MGRPDTTTLWVSYGKELRIFIERRVGDTHLAQDILHDVFLRIHARLNTLSDDEKVGKWVFQIARNRIIDYYKTRRYEHQLSQAEEELMGMGPEETVIEETMESTFQRGVLTIISFLPDFDRQLIRLSECEGIPQIELARRFNLPYSTVKSRIQRAKTKMKELMTCYCHIEQDACGRVVGMHPKFENECFARYKKI